MLKDTYNLAYSAEPFNSYIVEYRPSNLENAYVFYKNTLKQFTDSKHENVLTRTPFSINLKDALGVHQFGKNKT